MILITINMKNLGWKQWAQKNEVPLEINLGYFGEISVEKVRLEKGENESCGSNHI